MFLGYGLCNLVCDYPCFGGTCPLTYAQRWRCQFSLKYWKCTRLQGAKTQKPEICTDTDVGEDGLCLLDKGECQCHVNPNNAGDRGRLHFQSQMKEETQCLSYQDCALKDCISLILFLLS